MTQSAPSVAARPSEPAADDHGRPLTTNAAAAAWYRVAQRRVAHVDGPDRALRRALQADPSFALAASDLDALDALDALDERPSAAAAARPSTTWERHHCEIVAEAEHNVGRASGILREHLATAGCDPLAVHVVAAALREAATYDAARFADLTDLLRSAPDCHAVPAPPAPPTSPPRGDVR
ncbi:MAG: hypothetical protein ACRDZZ_01920 [Ilumatobacteraceae bacterium]